MPMTGHPADPPVRRPTSKDVAQAAGVSQSTVSIVLAGKWTGRVSPDTADSVRAAASRLGYRLNRAASNLRLGQARTVLLVVPTLSSPFFGPMYTGAARVAADRGFSVLIYLWPDGAGVADSPFAAAHEAIDGILASSMAVDALAELSADAMPLVMLDSDPGGAAPTVNLDVAAGFRAIVAHLAGLGHRRFGHLSAAVDTWTFRTRSETVTSAVEALPGAVLLREYTAIDIPAARAVAGDLLRRPDRPTALICDDDLIAAGAYKAARDLGLAVPADLSITGFDDVLLAEALEPELTTVRLPAQELGAQGMRALLGLLDGHRPAPVSLPGTFVARDSTGPAPR
jgi:LacI family transcriptional regulator